jgi:hypothetical protein
VFIRIRDALTLDSISMAGDFRLDEWVKITPEQREHGRQVLNDRAIKNFIQRKTNDNLFDLLRSAHESFPPHDLKHFMLCINRQCPYQSVRPLSILRQDLQRHVLE